ncbi:MAG: hypothetical protein JXB47_03505 [Anaerolineae bacterium]|nr:hypothetical protein [Anaerolineae bacterium]
MKTKTINNATMEASIRADARKLSQRFANTPVMSTLKHWPGPRVQESHYRAAVLTTQDEAAGLTFEITSSAHTAATFYLRSMLGLRFDLSDLTGEDKQNWLDEIRPALRAVEAIRRDSTKRDLAHLIQNGRLNRGLFDTLDDDPAHRSLADLIRDNHLDSGLEEPLAGFLEYPAFEFLELVNLLEHIARPIFLWTPARWEGTYIVFVLYKEFMYVHAFSPQQQGVARVVHSLVQELIDWIAQQWNLF